MGAGAKREESSVKDFDEILEIHRTSLKRQDTVENRLIDQHLTIAELTKRVHHELRELRESLALLSDAQKRLEDKTEKLEYRVDLRDVQD